MRTEILLLYEVDTRWKLYTILLKDIAVRVLFLFFSFSGSSLVSQHQALGYTANNGCISLAGSHADIAFQGGG